MRYCIVSYDSWQTWQGTERHKERDRQYQEHCRQTESWQIAAGLVWSPVQQATAGMLRASCRQTTEVPAHTDCCVSMSTTVQSHEAVVPDTAAGMLPDHTTAIV